MPRAEPSRCDLVVRLGEPGSGDAGEPPREAVPIDTPWARGWWSPSTGLAQVSVGPPLQGVSLWRRVDAAIRTVFCTWVQACGGVALHAATVLDGAGRAHLFVGASGAGKTTVARAVPLRRRLGDELGVVLFEPDGLPVAWGTPFSGRERTAARLEHAPLGGIWLLDRTGAPGLETLGPARAFAALAAHALRIDRRVAATRATLAALRRLVEGIRVARANLPRGVLPFDESEMTASAVRGG